MAKSDVRSEVKVSRIADMIKIQYPTYTAWYTLDEAKALSEKLFNLIAEPRSDNKSDKGFIQTWLNGGKT